MTATFSFSMQVRDNIASNGMVYKRAVLYVHFPVKFKRFVWKSVCVLFTWTELLLPDTDSNSIHAYINF